MVFFYEIQGAAKNAGFSVFKKCNYRILRFKEVIREFYFCRHTLVEIAFCGRNRIFGIYQGRLFHLGRSPTLKNRFDFFGFMLEACIENNFYLCWWFSAFLRLFLDRLRKWHKCAKLQGKFELHSILNSNTLVRSRVCALSRYSFAWPWLAQQYCKCSKIFILA